MDILRGVAASGSGSGSLGAGGVWNFRSSFPNLLMGGFMWGMVGSLAMFISSWDKTDQLRDQYLGKHRSYGDTYDFIVVGGGTAGSVVAYRLSEFYKVLLLEAGGEPHPFTSIPLMANFISNYPQLDWSHQTTPQKHAFFASKQNIGRISGGKGLGGSSNLDYMMYLRGNPQDYDNWAKVTGESSLSYANLLKYFKRSENYKGFWNHTQMHGVDGEIKLATNDYNLKMAKRFVSAGNEMGYPHADLNSVYSEGFDMLSYPMVMGHRQMAYKSFLKRPAHDRWHLVVHKYAHVKKILTRGDGPSLEAYGVSYTRHGEEVVAFARKEIVVSSGSINSPKLLMLSGIGDSGDLQRVGIPAKVHLPEVGKNLQDHVGVYLGPFLTSRTKRGDGHTLLLDRDVSSGSFLQFTMGGGPLTSSGYIASGMVTSEGERISGNPSWPNIQLTMHNMALHSTSVEDLAHAHNFREDILKDYYNDEVKGRDSFHILVTATRPKSRGQVSLRNNDAYSPPMIDPKYFEEISDVGVLVDGMKKAVRLVEGTIHFGGQLGAHFTNSSISACSQWRFRSDEYWACYARLMTVSVGDVGGTCAIGKVVDGDFRVKGVERLRVIDASVMPLLPSSGLSAPTTMLGERGAALILSLWGEKHKAEKFNKDRKNMRDILNGTKGLLRGMDTPSLFMESLKQSPSFQSLSQADLNEAMEPPKGILRFFSPSFSTKKNPKEKRMNPFKLIGAMFKNSLTAGNKTDPVTTPTSAFPVLPIAPVVELRTPALAQFVDTITFTTETPPPKVETLFAPETHETSITTTTSGPFGPFGYISYPFEEIFLKPTTTTTQSPPPGYVLQPKPFSFTTALINEKKQKEKKPLTSILVNKPSTIFSFFKAPMPQTSAYVLRPKPLSFSTIGSNYKAAPSVANHLRDVESRTPPSPSAYVLQIQTQPRPQPQPQPLSFTTALINDNDKPISNTVVNYSQDIAAQSAPYVLQPQAQQPLPLSFTKALIHDEQHTATPTQTQREPTPTYTSVASYSHGSSGFNEHTHTRPQTHQTQQVYPAYQTYQGNQDQGQEIQSVNSISQFNSNSLSNPQSPSHLVNVPVNAKLEPVYKFSDDRLTKDRDLQAYIAKLMGTTEDKTAEAPVSLTPYSQVILGDDLTANFDGDSDSSASSSSSVFSSIIQASPLRLVAKPLAHFMTVTSTPSPFPQSHPQQISTTMTNPFGIFKPMPPSITSSSTATPQSTGTGSSSSYEPHITQVDNTFPHQLHSYSSHDDNSSPTPSPPRIQIQIQTQTFDSTESAPIPIPIQVQNPSQEQEPLSTEQNNSLASNVNDILRFSLPQSQSVSTATTEISSSSTSTSSSPSTSPSTSPFASPPLSSFFLRDPKLLSDEVDKIFSGPHLSGYGPRSLPLPLSIDHRFQPNLSDKVPFSKIINQILQKQKERMRTSQFLGLGAPANANGSPPRPQPHFTISEFPSPPPSHISGGIPTGNGASPSTSTSMNMNLSTGWPIRKPLSVLGSKENKKNMSFSIKILNH